MGSFTDRTAKAKRVKWRRHSHPVAAGGALLYYEASIANLLFLTLADRRRGDVSAGTSQCLRPRNADAVSGPHYCRGKFMHGTKFLMLAAIAGGCLVATNAGAQAQVSIDIGPAPECPYGYYDAAPYNCAPAGYYGPEWFNGSIFIGAGPWFHGASEFRGHVNNAYHPDHGYKGVMPNRGERAEPAKRVTRENFKGNEERDGRGHVTEPRH